MRGFYRRLDWTHHTAGRCAWPWRFDPTCPRCQARETQPQERLEWRLVAYGIIFVATASFFDQLWLGLGPLLLVAVALGLPLLLILRAAWLGRRRRASLLAPAVEAVARRSLGHRGVTHQPADIARPAAAAAPERLERSVRGSKEESFMSSASSPWTWGRIVAGVALLSVAVTAAVALGLRWGTPPYSTIASRRGEVVIVNRFTGQAWVVRGNIKYPVETEGEEHE